LRITMPGYDCFVAVEWWYGGLPRGHGRARRE
jgi:hypothetical protein